MKIYVVDLESVPTRYTCEWKGHIPALLQAAAAERDRPDVEIVNISGGEAELKATPGAFLNFAQTNVYKNNQLSHIAALFSDGKVSPGDHFIFTDAWHPGIIQLKYMSELLQIPVILHGLWHAGSYDPQDFLGRLIKDKRWTNHFEQSVWHCLDYNWYATDFHIQLFKKNVFGEFATMYNPEVSKAEGDRKYCRTGWPMEYMKDTLAPYRHVGKRDLILFPHRIAPEKQLDIFLDLAEEMPEYEWVVCQDQELTKPEFHKLLGESKMVFSANLQETLGISTCIEGPLVHSLPLAPRRLSYVEIFEDFDEFTYPSNWTLSFGHYEDNKDQMVKTIRHMMSNYESYYGLLTEYCETQIPKFFHADALIEVLFNG